MRDCSHVSIRAGVLYTLCRSQESQISSDGVLVSRDYMRIRVRPPLFSPSFLFVDKLVIGCTILRSLNVCSLNIKDGL